MTTKNIKEALGLDKDYKRVATILFDYLFRKIDKYEYRRQIGDRELAKQVWSRVYTNGYILLNCKLFAYAVHWNRIRGQSTSPAQYEIMQEDVAFLRGLDLNHIPRIYKPFTLFNYVNFENAILGSEELKTNIGKFVSKKLIFLVRHFGEDRDEIENSLFEHAIYALRKQYPFYISDLHSLNTCKTAARNKGHGLIEYYTRGKRNKLLKENGSFQAVNVPLDAVVNLSVQPEHEDPVKIDLQALASLDKDVRMTPSIRAFLKAASGHYDPGFTLFIGVDNSDAVHEWPYDRYMTMLRDYHLMSERQSARLLMQIRTAMS